MSKTLSDNDGYEGSDEYHRVHDALIQSVLIADAKEYLHKMREHTECCGTEIIRRLLAVLEDKNTV